MDKEFFNGKNVLVMGLGCFGGGTDSAVFACKAGANVTVTDLYDEVQLADSLKLLGGLDIEYRLGSHRQQDFEAADVIIVNPAVNPENSLLQSSLDGGAFVTSQIEIFFQLCPCPIVGITGSNGKSTTTALTAHLLRAGISQNGIGYENVWLGGNIGDRPLLCSLADMSEHDIAVLELSSFQLEQLGRIKKAPYISLITNLSPNHLDRHGSFKAYYLAKENIFKYQQSDWPKPVVSIFNADDSLTMDWFDLYRKEPNRSCLTFSAADVPDEFSRVFKLPGRTNLSNLAAALKVAQYLDLNDYRITAAVGTFEGLAHRLKLVAEINGLCWYDDSLATTPISAAAALDAFSSPKIIIAGGYDKSIPLDDFGCEIAQKAKAAILLGRTAEAIAKAIQAVDTNCRVEIVSTMSDAVKCAADIAESGDVVLLSPGCASYDMFDNYRQRGEAFAELVKAL